MKLEVAKLVLLMVMLMASAEATVMKTESIQSLTQSSNLIVLGNVIDIQTVLRNGEPWTVVSVAVEQRLKGHSSELVRVQIPGGIHMLNGRKVVTEFEGSPKIQRLEHVVLFLNAQPPAYSRLAGWSQGYWHVRNDNGREYVQMSADAGHKTRTPLQQFVAKIKAASKEKTQ